VVAPSKEASDSESQLLSSVGVTVLGIWTASSSVRGSVTPVEVNSVFRTADSVEHPNILSQGEQALNVFLEPMLALYTDKEVRALLYGFCSRCNLGWSGASDLGSQRLCSFEAMVLAGWAVLSSSCSCGAVCQRSVRR
jgi:hypothetical protein